VLALKEMLLVRPPGRRPYGPAAEPMGRFWEEVEARFRQVPVGVVSDALGPEVLLHDKASLRGRIYGPDVRAPRGRCSDEAAKMASRASHPAYADRVAYVKRNTRDPLEHNAQQLRGHFRWLVAAPARRRDNHSASQRGLPP
jgi:hypothetical protein